VVLPTGATRDATLVPKDALVLGAGRARVFVAEADASRNGRSVVRPVPVRPGVAAGSLIEVEGDLRPGQEVVSVGNERLRAGDVVQVMRSTSGAAEGAVP
jgi:hypothetical protein